ncbi:hypothetical protein VL10_14725 [Leclercia adecarboxylata]|nr:hypothetical protein VL10_14725 [Leclercia adecarboxylata]KMN63690.1 hypothetical protein VK95_18500 [Leclercia sp. LK8]
MHKWKIMFWLHWSLVVLNAVALMWFLIPVDSWFVMPCIIVTAMSVAPLFFSAIVRKKLDEKNIGAVYLNSLMRKKCLSAMAIMLIFYAWFWWSINANALLFGSVITSWLGNAVFWFVRHKDLVAILPALKSASKPTQFNSLIVNDMGLTVGADGYNVPSPNVYLNCVYPSSGSENIPFKSAGMCDAPPIYDHLNYVNPASGLPMIGGVGGIDVNGNTYGTDIYQN